MRILLFLLFPVFLSAQINRAYGVIEIGATFPTSSSTGPKFAYRPADSSFYRWSHGSTWVKIIGPSITSDTIFITDQIGTSYVVSGDTINLTPYLLKSDTTAMLVKYIERGDTASMLTNYPTFGDVNTSLGNYLPILGGTLTGTGGSGFIGFPSQGVAPGTPASGLNVYSQGSSFNWKGTDGHERQITSSLTGGRNYALPDVNGTFALGTGTADRSARWSATNTLGAGSWSDNLTRLQAQVPVQFQSVTTAGLPTGVTGYHIYNTTINGPGWYDGIRWNYIPKADRSAFTSTYLPFTNSSGQLTEASSFGQNLRYYNNGFANLLEASSAIVAKGVTGLNSGNADIGVISATGNGGWTFSTSESTGSFSFYDIPSNQFPFSIVKNAGNSRFTIASTTTSITASSSIGLTAPVVNQSTSSTSPVDYNIINSNGGAAAQARIILRASSNVNSVTTLAKTSPAWATYKNIAANDTYIYNSQANGNIAILNDFASGNISFIAGGASSTQMILSAAGRLALGTTSPQRLFHVEGEARISDLTTDTPTRIVGADADGDLADITWLNPASNSLGIGTTPTQELDVNGDLRVRDSTRLTTTPAHSAITGLLTRDANGWVGLASVGSGLSYSGGVLSATGGTNIYNSDGTLTGNRVVDADGNNLDIENLTELNFYSQGGNGSIGFTDEAFQVEADEMINLSTTAGGEIEIKSGVKMVGNIRAVIPSTGNLYFSQRFNSNADSAYYYIANYGDGERELAFGITDTASTGFTGATFYSDGAGEMNWELETAGASGNTSVKAQDGTFSVVTTGGNMALNAGVANEISVTGLVKAKQEAYYEITSTSSPQTFSNDYSDNFVNQGGTQASFTFLFPASPEDGQILSITWGNAISTLTLDGNGNTIEGSAVTTAVAGTRRQFKYYASAAKWFKIY